MPRKKMKKKRRKKKKGKGKRREGRAIHLENALATARFQERNKPERKS
jgi:hypothetical protein